MSLAFGFAIYFIIWWIVLFAMLPIGVRTSEEAGEESTPGFAESAPHRPRLLPKMLATTVIAGIVFAGVRITARSISVPHPSCKWDQMGWPAIAPPPRPINVMRPL